MKYTFEKPTITVHELRHQIEALAELLKKEDQLWKESFADTVPVKQSKAFDDDDLDEIQRSAP
jgi:hypothetical protein